MRYLKGVLEKETDVFMQMGVGREDARKRIVVLGFSLGCAVGGILMLSGVIEKIGGFVGMSGYLPFRTEIEIALENVEGSEKLAAVGGYLRDLLHLPLIEERGGNEGKRMEERAGGKVMLCTGEVDVKMRSQWGEEMDRVLGEIGFDVRWKNYEDLGHWWNGEELGDVIAFLREVWEEIDV